MKTLYSYLYLPLILFTLNLNAQDLPTVIPPSPTVANLMHFEELPVDLNTGIPSISLPIYSSRLSSDLGLNLGLSYHPSGINLDNRSGWTGNGWSLTGLGSISRTVMGKPDEHIDGLLGDRQTYASGSIYDYDSFSVDELNTFLWEIGKGRIDNQPDFFQFNFFGVSGRFVIIKENGQLKPIEIGTKQNLVIEFNTTSPNNSHGISNTHDYEFIITSFSVTDTRGYKFTFDEKEITNSVTRRIPSSDALVPDDFYSYYSSWQLTKVETPNGKILIEADYQSFEEIYETTKTYTYEQYVYDPYHGNVIGGQPVRNYISPLGLSSTYSEMDILTKKPSKITLKENEDYIHILFNTLSGHPEYDTNQSGDLTGSVLNAIQIKSGSEVNKVFEFNYNNLSRLMLTSVAEKSDGLTLPYNFTYDSNSPPSVGSEAKDFWGYYNASFLPPFGSPALYLENEQRLTNPNVVTTGVLTSISYPTAGIKEFDFESNTISYVGQSRINYREIPENRVSSSFKYKNDNLTNPSGSNDNVIGIMYVEDPQDINLVLTVHDISQTNPYYQDDLKFRVRLTPINQLPNSTVPNNPNHELNNFTLYSANNLNISTDPARAIIDIGLQESYPLQEEDGLNGLPSVAPYQRKNTQKTINARGYYLIEVQVLDFFVGSVDMDLLITKHKYVDLNQYTYGGGLRIKNVKFKDLEGAEQIASYDYNEFNSSGSSYPTSSGSAHRNYKIFKERYTKEILVQTSGSGMFGSVPAGGYFYDMIKSNSRPIASSVKGSHVSYKNVTVSRVDWQTGSVNPLTGEISGQESNGRTEYTFTTLQDFPLSYAGNVMPYTPVPIKDYQYGNLLKQEVYDNSNRLLKSIDNNYVINDDVIYTYRAIQFIANSCVWFNHHDTYDSYKASMFDYNSSSPGVFYVCTDYNPNTYNQPNTLTHIQDYFYNEQYPIYEGRALLSETTTKEYFYDAFNNQSVKETRQEFAYNPDNYQISRQDTYYDIKGSEEHLQTYYYYPLGSNLGSNPSAVIDKLVALNKITEVLETQSFRNPSLSNESSGKISETHNIYHDFDASLNDLILPKAVKVGKGSIAPEPRIEFLKYDDYGNPIELRKADGTSIVYLYGFNESVPVAKITNASYSTVSSVLGGTTSFAGNINAAQEISLRNATSLANTMISFYRYDPLVGVISTSDDKGYETTYEYDAFNRLIRVKDAQGHILGENSYRYKNQ